MDAYVYVCVSVSPEKYTFIKSLIKHLTWNTLKMYDDANKWTWRGPNKQIWTLQF